MKKVLGIIDIGNLIKFILWGVISFICCMNLFKFIKENVHSAIYMDQIRLLSDNLEKMLKGEFRLSDFFSVHSGHLSVGTYLILNYNINTLGLENTNQLNLVVPFLLWGVFMCVLIARNREHDKNIKNIIIDIIQWITYLLLLFSVAQYEIIWFSYGSIIYIGNFFFILSFLLLNFGLMKKNIYVIAVSTLIGMANSILFGSGYDYGFLVSYIIVIGLYILFNFKEEKKFIFKLYFAAGANFAFIIYLFVLSKMHADDSFVNLGGITFIDYVKFYFMALSSLFFYNALTVDEGTRIAIGVIFLLISFLAIYIYIKKQYYKKTYFPAALIAFGQLIFGSVLLTRVNYGIGYGMASRYYATYVFALIGVLMIYFEFFKELHVEFKLKLQNSVPQFSLWLFSLGVLFVISGQYANAKWEGGISPYREELSRNMVEYTMYYRMYDDEFLQNLYQDNAENIKKTFTMFEEKGLYSFRDETFGSKLTDSLLTSGISRGKYENDERSIYIQKDFFTYIYVDEATEFSFTLYNPDSLMTENYCHIVINDFEVCQDAYVASGDSLSYSLNFQPGLNRFRIQLRNETRPSDLGINEDNRLLGLMLIIF